MTVRVFISATSEDLKADCRPCVKRAIDDSDATGITMESWDTDFDEAHIVCRQKIEQESTHFVGIFAYRRGWVCPQIGKAITEAEFDWASGCKRKMGIFVPNPSTDFAAELRRRAQGQSPVDAQAQLDFLGRVSAAGTFMPFDDLPHLVQKVTRSVTRWTTGGLREDAKLATASAASPLVPDENDMAQLGRFNQVAQFNAGLQIVRSQGAAEAACFLIHGPVGFGHKELIKRLRLVFEQNNHAQPKCWPVAIGARWSGNSLKSLIREIAAHIDPGRVPESVNALAGDIKEFLETQHLVLEISDLQRFDGSLPAFVNDFWNPITSVLSDDPPLHQLVVLLSLEGALAPESEPFVFDPARDDTTEFELAHVIKLPALEAFTVKELTAWLRARMSKDPSRKDAARIQNEARELAGVLIAETGGEPIKLFTKLYDNATWIKEE